MPQEIGYFHPEREAQTEANKAWLEQNGLFVRVVYEPDAYAYMDVADAIDDLIILKMTENKDANTEPQKKAADTLKNISSEIIKRFSTLRSDELVCMFVDQYEKGLLEAAEEHWDRANAPTIGFTPKSEYL